MLRPVTIADLTAHPERHESLAILRVTEFRELAPNAGAISTPAARR